MRLKNLYPFILHSLSLLLILFAPLNVYSQTAVVDTVLANSYLERASKTSSADSALLFANKALEVSGGYDGLIAKCMNKMGQAYYSKRDYDKALEYDFKALAAARAGFGMDHPNIAAGYDNIGNDYRKKNMPDSALHYYILEAGLRAKINGENTEPVSKLYNKIANLYFTISSFNDAETYFRKALEIEILLHGKSHALVADSYFNIGVIFHNRNQFEEALQYHLQSLAIRKTYADTINADVADSYYNAGHTYIHLADYRRAAEYYQNALHIQKILKGENSDDMAKVSLILAEIYEVSGNYVKALSYYESALNIYKIVKGAESNDVALVLTKTGILYRTTGNFRKSMEYLVQALQMFIKLNGENHSSVAGGYSAIGINYRLNAEFDLALKYEMKALEIRKGLPEPDDSDLAASYNNIGVIYEKIGDYDRSAEFYNKAPSIVMKNPVEMQQGLAAAYNNLGNLARIKGEYDKSIELQLKSLEVKRKYLGEDHPDVVRSYVNIGVVYQDKNEFEKALEYQLRALSSRIINLGPNHPENAESCLNIGGIYSDLGDDAKASEYYSRALRIAEEASGRNNPVAAGYYNNMGLVYKGRGEIDKALEYYNESLEIKKKIYGNNDRHVAMTLENMANAYVENGDLKKGLEYFKESLLINRSVFGEKHLSVANTFYDLGLLYDKSGDFTTALRYFHHAATSCLSGYYDTLNYSSVPPVRGFTDRNRLLFSLLSKARIFAATEKALPGFTADQRKKIALCHYQACDTLIDKSRKEINGLADKLALGETADRIYDEVVDLLIPVSMDASSRPVKRDLEQAFAFSEKNKSSVLLEALADNKAMKFAGLPDSLLFKEQQLKYQISSLTRVLSEDDSADELAKASVRKQLFTTNDAYDSLIHYFEKRYPEYYSLKYNTKPLSVEDLYKLAGKETAIMSYMLSDSAISIFQLTGGRTTVSRRYIRGNLADSVTLFRYSLTLTSPGMKENYRRLGFWLYSNLIPEDLPISKKIRNLIIIPDVPLSSIPFESLLTEDFRGDRERFQDYPYLLRKYNISYTYSASLLKLTSGRKNGNNSSRKDLLAFAPVFDNNPDLTPVVINRSTATDSIMLRAFSDRKFLSPLPATETETENIAKLFLEKSLNAKILLRQDASESVLKSDDTEDYRIIHFATHGFVNQDKPELSGIMLDENNAGGEDGILYSGEIFNLHLNAELVVLSACETGLGKIRKGEGIIGLSRALLYAGANNIVVSLWQVSDESTSELMLGFYENAVGNKLSGDWSSSLRAAKLRMIDEGRYSHPFYWSPFVVIGR